MPASESRRSTRSEKSYVEQHFARRSQHGKNDSSNATKTSNSSSSGGGDSRNNFSKGAGSNNGSGGSGRGGGGLSPKTTRSNSLPLPLLDLRLDHHALGSEAADDRSHSVSSSSTTTTTTNDSRREYDSDEIAGVTGAVRTYQPFSRSERSSESLPEINIAVCGQAKVGKSSFIKAALDLPSLSPTAKSAERCIPVDGTLYLLRLLEISIDDIDTNDDGTIDWPETIGDKMMPKVDGALSLYDVQDKSSIQDLRDMLKAITKSSLPTALVACKCDTPPAEREVNPFIIEQNAKRVNKNIASLQVSELDPESHKRGMLLVLNAVVSASPEPASKFRRGASLRRRAHTSSGAAAAAAASLSPSRASALFGHSRASSEYTVDKDPRHARVDSSFPTYTTTYGDRLQAPGEEHPMQGSFLLEGSASEPSANSSQSSLSTDARSVVPGSSPPSALAENGATFDELVDRLLDQPTSKADLKFAAIFLALYRKFAAPGKLLEAVVQRFDTLEQNGAPMMMKSTSQLRYLAVMEKWVSTYPGDFAYPRTQRRLRTFAHKIADNRIYAAAAREINIALEAVVSDDDTEWACNDKDREASGETSRSSMASTASTLIDDPTFNFDTELSGTTLGSDELDMMPKVANQMMVYVEQAQRHARELQPIQRNPLTKLHWRALMEHPDEYIAKELTRIDWIMFSSIRPRDLVRHVSLAKRQKDACRNLAHVNRMIEHFNQVACWVANYVLLRDKPKHRVLMLEKFMRIARKLRELNNYNALGAVIAGVKSTSVHRLVQTRDLLPASAGKDWLKLEILMAPSRSHFAYRLAWENSSTERIPYLPLHRRDLATAEEGNKTFIGDEAGGRINWKKFEIMGEVIVSLQRAQGMPYKNLGGLQGNQQVRDLLLDVKLVKDEDDLYERSIQCEPPGNANVGASAKFKEFFKR